MLSSSLFLFSIPGLFSSLMLFSPRVFLINTLQGARSDASCRALRAGGRLLEITEEQIQTYMLIINDNSHLGLLRLLVKALNRWASLV